MRSTHWILFLAGTWAFLGVHAALATAGDFTIDKYGFFYQTSNSQPTTATDWCFNAYAEASSPLDFSAAQLTPPSGSPISLSGGSLLTLPKGPSTYSTQAQLDAAFADGAYTFEATSGRLSGDTASLTMPAGSFYPTAVPYLNASSFASLEDYDPSQSLQVTWNSFSPDARTTYPFVEFFILDPSNGYATLFTADTSTEVSNFTSATIPASTLSPDHQYLATLVFSNDIQTQYAYFSTYNTDIEKEYFTDITFTTVPEPSSIVLLGAGAIALYAVARRGRSDARQAHHRRGI